MQLEFLAVNGVLSYRRENLHGRPHLVVPMTMIVPGVLNGSKGPLLYPEDEVGKDPTPWNGMPITVYHPTKEGRNVSARDPEILENQQVGVVLRATTNGKLRAEAWVDVDKANKVDQRVVQQILARKPLEISTGLFTDNTPAVKGSTWNGKGYDWVARNYRPDHLAILPDQKGACAIADGCGLGVNQKQEPTGNHIRKLKSGKYRLLSHEGENLGTFDSKAEAAKHGGEVEYFKSVGNAFSPAARQARRMEDLQKANKNKVSMLAHRATGKADALEGTHRLGTHSDLHHAAALAHEKAAKALGNSKGGKEHANLANIHRQAAAKLATDKAERMEGTKDLASHKQAHQRAMELHDRAGNKEDVSGHQQAVRDLGKALKEPPAANKSKDPDDDNDTDSNTSTGAAVEKAENLKKAAGKTPKAFGKGNMTASLSFDAAKRSEVAHESTKEANDTGYKEAHSKASSAHQQASEYHGTASGTAKSEGHPDLAKGHRELRDFHKTMSSHHKAQGTTENMQTNANPEGHNQWTHGTATVIFHGDTFRAKQKLKDEGFKWNADEKHWSKDLTKVVHPTFGNAFTDTSGNYKGTPESMHHMVKTYAKSDKVHMEIQHHLTHNVKGMSTRDLEESVRMAHREANPTTIDSQTGQTHSSYVEEVHDDHHVYSKSGEMFKQKHKMGEDGTCELTGNPQKVQKVTTYEPVTENQQDGQGGSSDNSNHEGDNMAKLTANQRAAIIDNLTSEKSCGCYGTGDKEYLQSQSDERLAQLSTNADAHLTTNGEKKIPETDKEGPAVKTLTVDEFMTMAPPSIRDLLTNAEKVLKTEKDGLIAKLVANLADERKKVRTEALQNNSVDELKDMLELATANAQTQNTQQRPRPVYGPTGQAIVLTDNKDYVDTDVDEMTPSGTDWIELSKMNGARFSNAN